jgi:hypothetical protein
MWPTQYHQFLEWYRAREQAKYYCNKLYIYPPPHPLLLCHTKLSRSVRGSDGMKQASEKGGWALSEIWLAEPCPLLETEAVQATVEVPMCLLDAVDHNNDVLNPSRLTRALKTEESSTGRYVPDHAIHDEGYW